MAGQHHQCNEHELRQTPGDGEGQGGLECSSPWGHKESDTTGRLNNSNLVTQFFSYCQLFCYFFIQFQAAQHVGSQFPSHGWILCPPAMEVQSFNHWTFREVPSCCLLALKKFISAPQWFQQCHINFYNCCQIPEAPIRFLSCMQCKITKHLKIPCSMTNL